MKVSLYDTEIEIKELGCAHGHAPATPVPKSVNIFVKVTNACNARCKFCSNANLTKSIDSFNHKKLWEVVEELQRQKIRVNRINITGGEPSIAVETVHEILERAENHDLLHLHLNTNGLLPSSQELMMHKRWDSISISLHHYEINKLSSLYGIDIPKEALKFQDIDLYKVNASCNLIRGFVDSEIEVKKMMNFIISLGIPRLGFVSLMKVNEFCKSHFIDYSEIAFECIPNMYFTESRNRGNDCKCSNYLYNNRGKILEVYMRNYSNPLYCESSLIYDGEYFRQGFHNDNIII